jgi:hypothetical protein
MEAPDTAVAPLCAPAAGCAPVRGPVQDESQFCDPMDAAATREIEGRSAAEHDDFIEAWVLG